jgi:RNA polymerase sigma-70 factor (sigma-E family)
MTGDVWPVPDAAPAHDVDRDFETFVRAETAALLRTAYLLTGESAAAEDVVQETLTRLYPRWHRVIGADSPPAYVRRSLVNTFLNGRRSASSREVIADIRPVADSRRIEPDIATAAGNRDELWRLLSALPARQRAALVFRYYLDLTDRETARELGCRPGTVRSLISRSLATLREPTSASAASRTPRRPAEGGGDE